MEVQPLHVSFDQGSLLLKHVDERVVAMSPDLVFDDRVKAWRMPAFRYAELIRELHEGGVPFIDDVAGKCLAKHAWTIQSDLQLRDYQAEALDAWEAMNAQGLIVLPTGVGKSIVGIAATVRKQVSTLVIVPTIDLMQQWSSVMERHLGEHIGMFGGGEKDLQPITVTTYDSANRMMEFWGDQFGLVIFDEAHHLPGPVNRLTAELACAPYRLALTATPERPDRGEEVIYRMVGPEVFRREIDDFRQDTLAPYTLRRVYVDLTDREREAYERARGVYREFLQRHGIDLAQPNGWQQFIQACARYPDGREALEAYHQQKNIALGAMAKMEEIWRILKRHRGERILIFTAYNELAYRIGEVFLLPVITHQTRARERKTFLELFREGELSVLVTSRVLNEGIDVPEASVGIVVSGTGSVREYIQRLGRILRPRHGKQAILYELISGGTTEHYIAKRRRGKYAD
ncbi:MAG: DEAD/DEAH box helicase [Lentisphaerae bacterium]|nr:MAG: DEAD/DEAH box helicase [Lentisphaerota bacterium]